MTDYIFNFTDPAKAGDAFVVKPYTVNGPTSPTNAIPYPPYVSATTTLKFVGKGVAEYGEIIQENFLHLLENFSNDDPPVLTVEGQLWYNNSTGVLSVYDGSSWKNLAFNGSSAGDFDVSGFKVINLANATNPTDAVNLQTADMRYVNVVGDTLTGSLTLTGGSSHVILPNAPTDGNHATNKAYVDGAISTSISGLATVYVNTTGDTMTGGLTITSGGLNVTGGVTLPSGNLTLTAGNLSVTGNVTLTSGTLSVSSSTIQLVGTGSQIDMNSFKIVNLLDPTNPQDAATKAYVDASTAGGGTDGVVYAGSLNTSTGVLTLNRTNSLADVTVSGTFAAFAHQHQSGDISFDANPSYSSSVVRLQTYELPGYPTSIMLEQAINVLDQAVYALTSKAYRQIIVQTVPGNTTFVLDSDYVVNDNRLFVYDNGVKQYASFMAAAAVEITPTVHEVSDTGLAASTAYQFDITVDGVLYSGVTVTTGSTLPITFSDLAELIDARLIALSIPAVCIFADSAINIYSNTRGAGSQVTITDISLFTALTGAFNILNSTITTDYAYEETGVPFELSDTIVFNVAPAVGSVLEFTILPT